MTATPDQLEEAARRIYEEEGVHPSSFFDRLQCRAEEWIYDLNARNHWIFRLYDAGNEVWARLAMGRVRREAARYRVALEGKEGARADLRPLTFEDLDRFAELLAQFEFEHLPPHPLDRAGAEAVLQRANHLPFGIFDEDGRLIGYTLVRLFFPFRAATGVWSLSLNYAQGISRAAVQATAELTGRIGLADYVTVPLDNIYSLRGAQWAGWRIVRTNRHFHVLLHRHSRDGS